MYITRGSKFLIFVSASLLNNKFQLLKKGKRMSFCIISFERPIFERVLVSREANDLFPFHMMAKNEKIASLGNIHRKK